MACGVTTSSTSGPRSDSSVAPAIGEWRDLLARFPSAPSGLVQRRELSRRADSKFVVSPAEALAVLPPLAGDYAVLAAGDGLVASYRTLYFDTPSLGNQLKTVSVVVRDADSLTRTYARVTSTYDPSTGQCTSPPC